MHQDNFHSHCRSYEPRVHALLVCLHVLFLCQCLLLSTSLFCHPVAFVFLTSQLDGATPLLPSIISFVCSYALYEQTFQSPGCPFKGVSQKCTEPLVYGWAEIYQVPLYTVGLRYIKCPCIRLGRDISSALFYASAQIISTTLFYASAQIYQPPFVTLRPR